MKKTELQICIIKLKVMRDFAERDGELTDLDKEQIKALAVACEVMQEKCNSLS